MGPTYMCQWLGSTTAQQADRILDGKRLICIHANLRATADTTTAKLLSANQGLSFMGDTKGGAFDIDEAWPGKCFLPERSRTPKFGRDCSLDQRARRYLPPRGMWIIDFGINMSQEEAARYEQPFAYVERHVRPEREKNKRQAYRERWWIHVEARPAMLTALRHLGRFLATTTVSKHRLFSGSASPILPDHDIDRFRQAMTVSLVFSHCRVHEVWARARDATPEVESGFRYTPTTCFETFPFPECEGGAGRRRLPRRRRNWTTFATLAEPAGVDQDGGSGVSRLGRRPVGAVHRPGHVRPSPSHSSRPHPNPLPEGEGTSGHRHGPLAAAGAQRSRLRREPEEADADEPLQPASGLAGMAHKKLDAAVFAAYGWDPGIADEQLLEKLLALNLERAGKPRRG